MLLLEAFTAPIKDCFPAQVAIISLLILIGLDWVFGVSNAAMHHEFSSQKMREGISHKCSEIGFVFVGVVLDAMFSVGLDLGFNGPILMPIVIYLCIMEVGSLLEIFAKINPDIANSPVFKLLASTQMIREPEEDLSPYDFGYDEED